MKTLRFSLIVAVIALGAIVKAHAQDPVPYLTLKQMPNIINCLPAPPDTASEMFQHDKNRFFWGKEQRLSALQWHGAMLCGDMTMCSTYSASHLGCTSPRRRLQRCGSS